MRIGIGITHRFFLAITTAALLSVVSLVVIMQWNLNRGFLRYINTLEQTSLSRLASQLEQRYAANGNWKFLRDNPDEWQRILAGATAEHEMRPRHRRGTDERIDPHRGKGPMPEKEIERRFFLLDEARQPLIKPRDFTTPGEVTPLHHEGRIAGYIGLMPHKFLSNEHQRRFLKDQKTAFALVGGVILLLAAGLSLPLSFRLVRPLRALATATDNLAAGRYDTRVPVTSCDELGQLARDFNALALALEKNEQTRRGWVADISHELRTPLAVLLGEIEAIQDGIRPLSRESVDSLHQEVLRLARLVGDLYQLSLSDVGALSYRMENVDLAKLIREVTEPYAADFNSRGIAVKFTLAEERNAIVFADPARLQQLFANLLDNSLKYTDPGGRVEIRLTCSEREATVEVEDSAPGVSDVELERLFDRLYRVENSRSRSAGGAGLGLAICRNIAAAHEGSITAHKSSLGGVLIRVVLPLWGVE